MKLTDWAYIAHTADFFLDSTHMRRADQGESGNCKAFPGDLKIKLARRGF